MTKQIRIYLFLFLATLLAGLPAYGKVGNGIITMTTSRKVGESIRLDISADGGFTIEGAVKGGVFGGNRYYRFENQQIIIRGNVTELKCADGGLTTLNASGCTALTKLDCNEIGLTALDVSGCTALKELDCGQNQMTTLNISGCTALTKLVCNYNQLTTLDVSGCTALTTLNCNGNQLTALDVSSCIALTKLDCWKNQLTKLDVSSCTALKYLDCAENQINAPEMSLLVRSLPDKGDSFYIVSIVETERNVCYRYEAALAQRKGWKTLAHTNVSPWYRGYGGMTPPNFIVTKTIEGKGTLNVTGTNNLNAVPYGIELTIEATPADGYEFVALTANGKDILTTKKFVVTGATEVKAIFGKRVAVTLSKEGEGSLAATGATDLSDVPYGTELTIEDTPAEGYELTALTANGTDILATKKIVVKVATEIKATFAKKTFTVTLAKVGEGSLHATGANDLNAVDYGTELTIDATPADGYYLMALTANGTDILTTKKVTVKEGIKVTAIYAKKTFGVTLRSNEYGSISIVESIDPDAVPYGTELTIKAQGKDAKCELTALTANGVDILATKKFVVTGSTVVKATFAKPGFAVTLTKDGEGTLNATGADDLNAVPEGTELTIEAIPAEGYTLVALTANGADILASKKVVVKEDTEVKAIFTKKTFAVKLTKEGEGSLNATGADNLNAVEYGTELTIEATPEAGYELKALTANGTDILATRKVVVKESTEVKATFAKKTFTVTLTKEGEGILRSTGAGNLKSVMYATELAIIATPADGYELKALTANGADILASKKVVVNEDTEVKAIFAKKIFAVELTQEGEGLLNATGADDLTAVPFDTELTIEASPAEDYTLVALTANGADILATKKVVVKEATEVKAIFAKKTFAVTLTKEGEGTLNATGADNLNAVKIDTELTIEATPAEGYYLMALTANGTDILATRKVVVKEAMEVKATFAKKTFAVTLTNEGEGMLNATGADNLNAVAYGTELTIEATPAAGYELKALTANGADILATKKVVVKEATEVKATFAKKTFAVTLTKEAGEGTLNATGADDLNAVPFDTELTIDATPAEGYELTALTANGTDILATKKVVVKEATEVKATFAKKTFTVTLTKEGEGILRSTGAGNLKSVMYATELTIIATPADGYELKALTANGADILASKKVVVKENTEVKAIFTKKTFAVELTQEGEGLLDATGADDLSAVPLDTELTIVATPADGYELKALTANGTDILATKKFVVKGATKIKATFTKKTAANRVESSSVRLYPNPASTYVNVKAAKADALVRLYDANGTLLYEARTDDHGMLQIELSAYAEGTYLLRVGGDAQRLLIQR